MAASGGKRVCARFILYAVLQPSGLARGVRARKQLMPSEFCAWAGFDQVVSTGRQFLTNSCKSAESGMVMRRVRKF